MSKKIVLIGAGGFGREVVSIIKVLNNYDIEHNRKPSYEFLGFLDDNPKYYPGDMIDGYPWLGKKEWILDHKDEVLCNCTIGKPSVKAKIQRSLENDGVKFETITSRGSYIFTPLINIGAGCVFYGGVTISVNCKIGAGVLLNQNVNIGHDVIIGDFTTIMPGTGISGGCKIGDQVNIGGHAFIIPGRKIGERATIAAGSIVFSNVKTGTTVLGNPAHRMKGLES